MKVPPMSKNPNFPTKNNWNIAIQEKEGRKEEGTNSTQDGGGDGERRKRGS